MKKQMKSAQEVIMLIGLPGSGKSHWLKQFFESKPSTMYAVISSDDILMQWATRDGLTYDEAHATYDHELVKTEVINKMRGCIRRRYNIIIDQVNASKETRAAKLTKFPESYVKKAVVFDLPLELILARQATPQRVAMGKSIPESVMLTLIEQYVIPDYTEFDEIIYVTE